VALLSAICATAQGLSQSVDPGLQFRREQERTGAQRQRLEKAFDVKSELPAVNVARLPIDEAPCFRIEQIEIRVVDGFGNDPSQPSKGYDWLLQSLAGAQADDPPQSRCLGTAGIAIVLRRAQDRLVAEGLVTSRVLAQQQDISAGTLVLTVLPGRVNIVRFKEPVAPRVALINSVPVQVGDVLNLRDVEQGLENLKRVPTVEADIQIEPAQDALAIYQSDLVITYSQKQRARFSVSVDDSGSKSTGKYQGNATLSLDSPLGLSDLFYLTTSHDLGGGDDGPRGTQGHTVHYSFPMDYWSLAATSSSSRYFQSVAGLSQDYVYSGTSENSELKLSRLVYRDESLKTSLSLKAWQRKSNNFIDDTEVQVQRRVVGGWELGASHRAALGDATLEANIAYKRGTDDFDSIAAPEELFDEGTAKLGLVLLDLNASTPFKAWDSNFKFNAALRVQDNTTRLTPQDRFAIGGRYTVRGFDGESSLSAERGWTLRNDLGLLLGQSGQEAYVGLDAGEISGPSAKNLLGNALSGAVIGLRGAMRAGAMSAQYDVFLGGPIAKPEGFKTADTCAGFFLSVSL
jgi:hemolysin activation/secretion protein